jgi:hypothetical protein
MRGRDPLRPLRAVEVGAMSPERMKTLSRLFLIVGLLLSVIVWYMIPAMTVKAVGCQIRFGCTNIE